MALEYDPTTDKIKEVPDIGYESDVPSWDKAWDNPADVEKMMNEAKQTKEWQDLGKDVGPGYIPPKEFGGYLPGFGPSAPSGYKPNPPKLYVPSAETKVQTDVLKSIKAQVPLLMDEFGLGKLGVAVLKNIGDEWMMKKGVPLNVNAMAKWNQAEMDMVVATVLQDILNNPLQMSYLEKWNQDEYIANLPNMGAGYMPKEWGPKPEDFIKQGIYMPWSGWSGAPLFDPSPPNPRLLGDFSGPVAYSPSAPNPYAPNPYARTSYGFNWLPRYLRRI